MSNQNAVQPLSFVFENEPIRVVTGIDNKPLFCVADICRILKHSNASKAIEDMCDEKGITKCYTLTNGGKQELLYITEPNLYRLVCRSNLPAAVQFEKWVFDVLIPAAMNEIHGINISKNNTARLNLQAEITAKRAQIKNNPGTTLDSLTASLLLETCELLREKNEELKSKYNQAKRVPQKFTAKDDETISLYWGKKTVLEIARLLGRKQDCGVRNRAVKLGLK